MKSPGVAKCEHSVHLVIDLEKHLSSSVTPAPTSPSMPKANLCFLLAQVQY